MQSILFNVDRHAMRHVVPGPVFRQGVFKWRPSDKDGDDAAIQLQGLADWRSNPHGPVRFMVTAWDQFHADYVAAWLVNQHIDHGPHHEVLWLSMWDDKPDRYTGAVPGPVPRAKREIEPTLVVATGIGVKASRVQKDKVRDLHERYPTVPLIVAGFGLAYSPRKLAADLLLPLHRMLYILPLRSHESATQTEVAPT